MIRIGVSGCMFLLVPAHLCSSEQNPESNKTVVVKWLWHMSLCCAAFKGKAFSALTLLVGLQEEHLTCKTSSDEVLVICVERGVYDLRVVQLLPLLPSSPHHLLLHLNPEWFIFLAPAYPSCPGKSLLNGCNTF